MHIVRLVPHSRSEFEEESENRKVNGSDGGPSANDPSKSKSFSDPVK